MRVRSGPRISTGMGTKTRGKASQMSAEAERRFSVVSLFSGCGGMDLGFKGGFEVFGRVYSALPFDIVWANDINLAACATYRKQIGAHIVPGPMQDTMSGIPTRADVVIGGFPCQDISINGLQQGVDGERSGLYRAMARVVEQCHPMVFVAENVKQLVQEAEWLRQVLEAFQALNYVVSYRVYQAADYGVPQSRERVFIVGTAPNVAPFLPPMPTTLKGERMTCQQAIDDLADAPENPAINHIWSRAKRNAEQGDRDLKANKPSHTIRAEHHGNIQFHYQEPRRISLREAARLQSFPDNFIFEGGMREAERQIGNAVPPILAWHIANAILACLPGTRIQRVSSRELAHQPALAIL